jgi:hypothetical protein
VNQRNYVKLEKAAIIISIYTALLHFLSLFYAIAILTNSVRTDTFYSPLFEFNRPATEFLAGVLILYSIAFIVLCSWGLIHGVQSVSAFSPLSLFRHEAPPAAALLSSALTLLTNNNKKRQKVIRADLNNEMI